MANDTPAETTELEPINSRQFVGHLGHLTPDQQAKLAQFKQRLERRDDDDQRATTTNDDVTLVRFLRARKFDLESAWDQFTAAERWRRSNKVDDVYDEFDLGEFELAQRLYPRWTGRRDRSGLPVYVFKVSSLAKRDTDEYAKNPERLNPRMIALYEHMVQFVLPLCSSVPHAHEEVPVSGCATIVDISNVSLMRFWQLKSHMQRASALASANYAETLGAIYLVGAPNFFSTVWGWCTRWFDPGTVEKIFILPSHSVLSTLSSHIDPDSIPKEFGGNLDWTYSNDGGDDDASSGSDRCRPSLDEATKRVLGLDQVPDGPLRWISSSSSSSSSDDGQTRGHVELKGTGRDPARVEAIERELKSRRRQGQRERTEPVDDEDDATKARQQETSGPETTTTETGSRGVGGVAGAGAGGGNKDPRPVGSVESSVPTTPNTSKGSSYEDETTTTSSSSVGEVPPPVLGTTIKAEDRNLDEDQGARLAPPIHVVDSLAAPAREPTVRPEQDEGQHDIAVAAREHPAAPLKDLAATLEGTTL